MQEINETIIQNPVTTEKHDSKPSQDRNQTEKHQQIAKFLDKIFKTPFNKLDVFKKKSHLEPSEQEPIEDNLQTQTTQDEEKQKIENQRLIEEQAEEQEELEKDLIKTMDRLRKKKHERITSEKSQENAEREFNETLTSIEEIKVLGEIGDKRVQKKEIQTSDGKTVTIYELKNLPFRFLQHALDYKKGEVMGAEAAKKAQEEPTFWDMPFDKKRLIDVELSSTICTSYVDLHINANPAFNKDLFSFIYGFDHIEPGSLVSTAMGDARSSQKYNKTLSIEKSVFWGPNKINTGEESIYNEIEIKRYQDDGRAKRPDFIIVRNNEITEAILKHAAYFNIPIISLDTSSYREENEKTKIQLLNSINEETSFEKIREVINKLDKLSGAGEDSQIYLTNILPLNKDVEEIKNFDEYANNVSKYYDEIKIIRKLEMTKRIEYIKNMIIEQTNNVRLSGKPETSFVLLKKHQQTDDGTGKYMAIIFGYKNYSFYIKNNKGPNTKNECYEEINTLFEEYQKALEESRESK